MNIPNDIGKKFIRRMVGNEYRKVEGWIRRRKAVYAVFECDLYNGC